MRKKLVEIERGLKRRGLYLELELNWGNYEKWSIHRQDLLPHRSTQKNKVESHRLELQKTYIFEMK
ncbi:hypothetical protein D3C71_1372430 [compost metagenome]